MNKDNLNCSGIYFLASRFLDGSYIYKVGKAACIKDRVNQYPQNFTLVTFFECTDKNISEKEVLNVVENMENEGIRKCERGNEYFQSETDKTKDIKLAIYEWYYELERTRIKTLELTRTFEDQTMGFLNEKRCILPYHKYRRQQEELIKKTNPGLKYTERMKLIYSNWDLYRQIYNNYVEQHHTKFKESNPELGYNARMNLINDTWIKNRPTPKDIDINEILHAKKS